MTCVTPAVRFSLLGTTLFALVGCAGAAQRGLGVMSGTVNDPSNRTLRREILRKGMDDFCHQVMVHDAPLKLVEDSPVIGRFFPTGCSNRELDSGNVSVRLDGVGFAWTNLTKKSSFSSSATVDYDVDFRMSDSTMYVYFRTKKIAGSQFQTKVIEQPLASMVHQWSQMGDRFGQQLLSQKLAEGFTILRDPDGTTDFSLGFVEMGKRPAHPYSNGGKGRLPYESMRTEIHQNQRDFIGPIEVEDDDLALYITARVDGGLPIDFMLLRKDAGETAVRSYLDLPQAMPLALPPLLGDVIQPSVEYKRRIPVAKGTYFVLFDNTATAGQVAPASNALDDRAAVVSYLVEVGAAE